MCEHRTSGFSITDDAVASGALWGGWGCTAPLNPPTFGLPGAGEPARSCVLCILFLLKDHLQPRAGTSHQVALTSLSSRKATTQEMRGTGRCCCCNCSPTSAAIAVAFWEAHELTPKASFLEEIHLCTPMFASGLSLVIFLGVLCKRATRRARAVSLAEHLHAAATLAEKRMSDLSRGKYTD